MSIDVRCATPGPWSLDFGAQASDILHMKTFVWSAFLILSLISGYYIFGPKTAAQELSSEAAADDAPLTVADAPPPVTSEPADLEGADQTVPPAVNEPTNNTPSPTDESSDSSLNQEIDEAAPDVKQKEEPPPPTPSPVDAESAEPKPTKSKKKTAKKTSKFTMVFSKAGSKVPKGLKKDKVFAYVARKLDGNTSCIPTSLSKKQVKPFVATVSFTKGGTISDVHLNPKMHEGKVVATCIKKNLAGSPALFKGKSTHQVSLSFKIK
jgi:hypothetical protein